MVAAGLAIIVVLANLGVAGAIEVALGLVEGVLFHAVVLVGSFVLSDSIANWAINWSVPAVLVSGDGARSALLASLANLWMAVAFHYTPARILSYFVPTVFILGPKAVVTIFVAFANVGLNVAAGIIS